MRFYHFSIFPAIITIAILFSGCTGSTEGGENTDNDGLIAVSNEQFREEQMQLGSTLMHTFTKIYKTNGIITASPQSKADVYSYVSGIVRTVKVNLGSHVRKGQLLCTVESKEFINLQRQYLESMANLKAVETEYERTKALYEQKIASQKSFIAIESEYNMLQAKLKALRAELKILNVNVKNLEAGNLSVYLPITSPIEGYITVQNSNVGQFIDSQTLLMKVIDNRDLQVHFYVYQENVSKLKAGQLLNLYSPDNVDKIYTARIFSIGKYIDPETKSIDCLAEPDEEMKKIFVDGMYFQVEVSTDTIRALAVPDEAVIKSGDRYYLLVKEKADENNLYLRKEEISIGMTGDGFTQIVDGKPFNDVLVKGAYYFKVQ